MRRLALQSVATAASVLVLLSASPSVGAASAPPCPIPVPLLGWSSWNSFGLRVNESLILDAATTLAHSTLGPAGYTYVLLDDGWTNCQLLATDGSCAQAGNRDAAGNLVADPQRFPSGLTALTSNVHALGLKIGIYTAVSATTCGGFTGSLGHEAIDAAQFAAWGFDFVKHDTCNADCGIHDGCMQNSTRLMSDALASTGRAIVYYIDGGNPTSGQRVLNPRLSHVDSKEIILKVARRKEELIWNGWGAERAHMFKSWFDRSDSWSSMMDNFHHQASLSMFSSCCSYHFPDMLTLGQGNLSPAEERVEFFLATIMAAPIILGLPLHRLNDRLVRLLTNPELLSVAQDADCAAGSLVSSLDATEVWARSLSDGSFVAVLINKDAFSPRNVTLHISNEHNGGDLYPAHFEPTQKMQLRDLHARSNLGEYADVYTALLQPHDAQIIRLTASSSGHRHTHKSMPERSQH